MHESATLVNKSLGKVTDNQEFNDRTLLGKEGLQNSSNRLIPELKQYGEIQNQVEIKGNNRNDSIDDNHFPYSLSSMPIFAKPNFRIQPKLSVNVKGDEHEQEADNMAEKISKMSEWSDKKMSQNISPVSNNIHPVSLSIHNGIKTDDYISNQLEVTRGNGENLDKNTENLMSAGFGFDFSKVKIHTSDVAAKMNQQLQARAFTVGNDIYFNKNNYDPATRGGRHLLAHELTHTVQQSSNLLIMRKSLSDLPETTRKKIQVSRSVPEKTQVENWIKLYFVAKPGITLTPSFKTELGAGITGPILEQGLTYIAIELFNLSPNKTLTAIKDSPEEKQNNDPENWPLGPNSVLDIAMDLSKNGGDNSIFRFTRYTDGNDEKVIIEKVRTIAPAVVSTTLAAAAVTSYTGNVTVGNVKVDIDSSLGNINGKTIAGAIQLLPDPIRLKIDGVKIIRAGSGSGPDKQNGDYNPLTDVIRIWDNMFNESSRRIGESSSSSYQVVHELMHAIDQRPLFKAQIARGDAQKRKSDFEAKSREVNFDGDPLKLVGETSEADKKILSDGLAKFDKEIADFDKAMKSAKSVSGSELGKDTEALTTDFGKALAADGVQAVKDIKKKNAVPGATAQKTLSGGITRYAATDLMEAFAENFSLYILDEALLKTLRPKTYEYFVKAYPKVSPAAKP